MDVRRLIGAEHVRVSGAETTLCGSVVLSECRRVVVQHVTARGLEDRHSLFRKILLSPKP